jgi:amicyanin
MNKTIAGVIITVIAIAGVIGVVVVANKKDGNPTTANSSSGDHSNMGMTQPATNSQPSNNSANNAPSGSTPAVSASSVEIQNFAFNPGKITVKKGTKVTWTNQDSVKHNVAPDSASDNFKGSDLLAKGESYSYTFNTAGTYTYHCSPHPYMKGTVEVTE